MIKYCLVLVLCLGGCEACGYSSVDNHMTGQVKKVHHNTPMVCDNYDNADVSLGIMQGGVGSISNHDVQVTVPGQAEFKIMETAAKSGKLVEITFKERRWTTCIDDYVVTEAKLLDSPAPATEPPIEDKTSMDVSMNGHIITVNRTIDRITGLKIYGQDTPLNSAVGKAAIKAITVN